MTLRAEPDRRNKTGDERIKSMLLLPFLLPLLLAAAGRGVTAEYTVAHSRIGASFDGHSTTRTTVRRVFRHDRYSYVFCGDVRDRVYYNFFATSTDGIDWSERKVGSGGDIAAGPHGAPDLPETAIVYGDRIYGCYSEEGELRIRSGRLVMTSSTSSRTRAR